MTVRSLDDPGIRVRANAALALGRRREAPEIAVPALARTLPVRREADRTTSSLPVSYWAIRQFGDQAKSAVPALLDLVRSTNAFDRSQSTEALKKIDPDAAAKVLREISLSYPAKGDTTARRIAP